MLAIVLAVVGLRWLSPASALGSWLVRNSYDALFGLSPGAIRDVSEAPVVIVYLDLESYRRLGQDPARPLDRRLHERLVERLTAAGARAVVFDIVFGNPSPDAEADKAFAQALRANGHVILAGEYNSRSGDRPGVGGVAIQSLSPPDDLLKDAAAGWGLAHYAVDDDFVARRHFDGFIPNEEPSLVWATVRHLGLPVATTAPRAETRWMRYYGPPYSLPHVSYHQALESKDAERLFRGKIVFVGARPMTGGWQERRDEQRSPFSARWGAVDQFMPGVEVHATQLLNLLRGDWLRRTTAGTEIAGVVILALLLPWWMLRLRPVISTLAAVAVELVVLFGAIGVFAEQGLWMPWLIPVGLVPLALVTSVAGQSVQWYRERKQYHAKIQQQAELITQAQDAIVVLELDGRARFANPAAVRLYGWSEGDLCQPDVAARLWADSNETVRGAREATLQRGEWQGELVQNDRAGLAHTVQSRWTLVRTAAGHPDAFLVIHTDVTEQKKLEAQFLRAQRMDTIGSLAGGLVHDLNNALAPILMGVQWLRRRGGDTEAQRMFDIIESNTHRGADMARQVLLLARGRAADKELLAPADVLQELQRILTATFPSAIRLALLVPPDVWKVRGNSTQLHQALLNLCVNARDAMPEGGELTLAVDNVELGAEEAAAMPRGRPGEFVLFVVSDTGSGIPPELIPRLFDPFVTTKPVGKGTGLGLASVARIVDSHEGFVALRSEVGLGTTFEVYVPRAATTNTAMTNAAAAPVPVGQGRTVLLVEDEAAAREVLRTVLHDAGYRVLTATDGVHGLEQLRGATTPVDLVLVDSDMPRCGGRAMLREAWKEGRAARAILMSGHGVGDEADGSLPDGVRLEALSKPFDADQLLRLAGRLLEIPPRG